MKRERTSIQGLISRKKTRAGRGLDGLRKEVCGAGRTRNTDPPAPLEVTVGWMADRTCKQAESSSLSAHLLIRPFQVPELGSLRRDPGELVHQRQGDLIQIAYGRKPSLEVPVLRHH